MFSGLKYFNRLSLQARVTIPSALVLLFLLVVAVCAYSNFAIFGRVVEEVILSSEQTVTRETTTAHLISKTQQAVNIYFTKPSETNYQQAATAVDNLARSQDTAPAHVHEAIEHLADLLMAAQTRFANLAKQEKAFLDAQKEIQHHFAKVATDQVMAIVDLMAKVGNDMRSPDPAMQATINQEFETLLAPLPKNDFRFAIEDYWDIWAGYTAVYLKLQEDTTQTVNSTMEVLYSFQRQHLNESRQAMQRTGQETLAKIRFATWLVVVISVVAMACGGLLTFLLARRLTRLMTNITSGIRASFEQVAAASAGVSEASLSLSQGASQQAASIETISASLEEITAMANTSADNALQADQLMNSSKQIIDQGNSLMLKLGEAMAEITKANEQTFKIIGTIDQIAFQTNLLALNAAVEAARAGEAGAGFAVVADEVRNLAGRSADAARETTTLIDSSTTTVKEGANMARDTSRTYGEISDSSQKIGTMVSEISAASKEQAIGINAVKSEVVSVDQVAQDNVLSAEKMSASANILTHQAENLETYVNQLVALMEGGEADDTSAPKAKEPQRRLQY